MRSAPLIALTSGSARIRSVVLNAVILLLPPTATAQLRVANWNITNYNGGRDGAFQTAIYGAFGGRSMAPDAILTQEMISSSAVNSFLSILNTAPASPGDWAAAPFMDGPDTDNAFFYRTSKLAYLGKTVVAVGGPAPNHPRNVNRYDVQLIGYTAPSAVLACFSTHMKAGSTSDDQARRMLEAQRIRANARALPAEWSYMVAGDFNVQSSTQAAYQELTGVAGNPLGRFFDPIRTPGDWNNNSAFRFVHTQDPVGAGGMDDRHDQILVGAPLIDGDGLEYIGNQSIPYSTTTWDDPNHSFRAWGNDGSSFDTALRVTGNTMVGASIAQALRDSALDAGHLPVFLDLRVPAAIDSDSSLDFGTVPEGSTAEQTLNVTNAGDVSLWTAAGIDDLRYSMTVSNPVFSVPTEAFADAATPGGNSHLIALDTSQPGSFSATLTISSNAPDEPARLVSLSAVVQEAGLLPGDMNCDGLVSITDIGPFVLALTDPAAYAMQFPNCNVLAGDLNHSGDLTVADIGLFVALLVG